MKYILENEFEARRLKNQEDIGVYKIGNDLHPVPVTKLALSGLLGW